MNAKKALHIRRVQGQDDADEVYQVYVGRNTEAHFRPSDPAKAIGEVMLHCINVLKAEQADERQR